MQSARVIRIPTSLGSFLGQLIRTPHANKPQNNGLSFCLGVRACSIPNGGLR